MTEFVAVVVLLFGTLGVVGLLDELTDPEQYPVGRRANGERPRDDRQVKGWVIVGLVSVLLVAAYVLGAGSA